MISKTLKKLWECVKTCKKMLHQACKQVFQMGNGR